MLAAVDLDNQPRLKAREVREIAVNGNLPAKLEAAELTVADDRPQFPFGGGRSLPELAGAVGYFGADGSVDTCIVLRTALFKDGVIHVQAGGGVVADSDPVAEYEETLHKARAIRTAAAEAWRFA